MTNIEEIAAGKPVARKAMFEVGQYDDGSGPRATVSYDTTSEHCDGNIWIDEQDTQWAAFDHIIAEEMCKAIMASAHAIRTHLLKDKTHDRA